MTAREEWDDPHEYQDVPLAQDVIDEQDAHIEKLDDMLEYWMDEAELGDARIKELESGLLDAIDHIEDLLMNPLDKRSAKEARDFLALLNKGK
jgi:uncharacterized protein (DUF305 family)